MRLSRASRFLAVCSLALLVSVPAAVQAQLSSTREQRPTSTSSTTTVSPTPRPTENPRPPTTPTVGHTTLPAQSTRSVPTATGNRGSASSAAPTATGIPLPTDGTCVNTSACAALPGTVCGYASANATIGTCIASSGVCAMSPIMTCVTHADCPTEFSYCAANGGQMVCTGLGRPGTDTECKAKDGGIATTLKYAGIAVGCVAALGILFAGVRWQKRRQRSKGIPADMFGEVDYGMTDRAPSKAAEQNYPFSSRPNAHGSDIAPTPPGFDNGYDNNQYYEEPIGYSNNHNNNGYGHDQYDNGQYYGNQKDGYGYDQQQHHGGGGDGFYNNAGYDDYQQHPQGITSPAAAARVASPRQNFDQYGAEPSELDFGGHHGGSAHGGSGHAGGGYGRY